MTHTKNISSISDTHSSDCVPLTNMSWDEVSAWCRAHRVPSYRAEQIWQWVYCRNASSYDQMTNIPAALRTSLAEKLPLTISCIERSSPANDSSVKYVLKLHDDARVECVWIPMGTHSTVCISTQVGCPVKCRFCASGAHGLQRNLDTYEIVEQIVHIMRQHGRENIGNVVFMGTGEPFYNPNAFFAATDILNNSHGMCIGMRRMTVSTIGVIPGIARLTLEKPQMNLAVSLHAANDTLRKKIVPNCPSSLDDLMDALQLYYTHTHRRITFEYVLLNNVNDSKNDMLALAKYVSRVPSKVNLIPYNPVCGSSYAPPSQERCIKACDILNAHYITTTLRRRKGDDVNAACGQLYSGYCTQESNESHRCDT